MPLAGLAAVVLTLLAVILVLLPLVAAPSYLLDGLFIGAGATRAMMLGMLFSALAIYLPACHSVLKRILRSNLKLQFSM